MRTITTTIGLLAKIGILFILILILTPSQGQAISSSSVIMLVFLFWKLFKTGLQLFGNLLRILFVVIKIAILITIISSIF